MRNFLSAVIFFSHFFLLLGYSSCWQVNVINIESLSFKTFFHIFDAPLCFIYLSFGFMPVPSFCMLFCVCSKGMNNSSKFTMDS